MRNRKKYNTDRLKLIASGIKYDIKYVATKDGNEKKFKNREELSRFFGYTKDYMCHLIQNGGYVLGWKVERYKWYEHTAY